VTFGLEHGAFRRASRLWRPGARRSQKTPRKGFLSTRTVDQSLIITRILNRHFGSRRHTDGSFRDLSGEKEDAARRIFSALTNRSLLTDENDDASRVAPHSTTGARASMVQG
jgi:hypothetical protein